MHKSVCHSTGRAIVNKIKLLFIYVIFCFNRQTIASPTVRIACPKPRIYELPNRLIARYKLRIYELRDSELNAKNYEFHELHIVNCML